MTNRLDLPRRYRDQIEALLREHVPGVEVWAYGSRVSGRSHDASDLDLMLRGPDLKRIPSGQLADLIEALEESNVPIIVQIHDWARLPESFHKEIEREYVVLVEKEEQPFERRSSSAGGEWVRRRIGTLGRVVTGKTPSTIEKSNFDGPYPFITIPDLDGRVLIDNTKRTLSHKGAAILRTCLLPPGAVLMSCIATVGKCGVTTRPSFTNQQINSVIPDGGVDSRFLYYVFTQLGYELESVGGGGSVYTNVSKSRFSDIEVVIPVDLTEQRAIAHILGTLDDKIELNRRMNETLEEIARALFKSWFVDFDPVRAKMEGRDPGLPKHLADLFPDRLVDSELGLIPEGWEVKALEQFIELNPRESIKKGTIAPYLNMAALPTSGPNPDDPILREYTSGTRFRNGDTLFARITPCLENGKTAFLQALPKDTVGWGSTEFIVMRAIPPVTSVYPYLLARDPAFRAHAIQSMTGTSGRQRARTEALAPYQVAFPTTEVWTVFALNIEPLFSKIHVNSEESQILTALRNTLLPKLVSGKLRLTSSTPIVRNETEN